MRIFVLFAALCGFLSASWAAGPEPVRIQTADACAGRKDSLVCGVVAHRALILYKNECQARRAGAERIIPGPCDDTDD